MEKKIFIDPFSGKTLSLEYYFDTLLSSSEKDLMVYSCLKDIKLMKKNNINFYYKYDTLLKLLLTHKEYNLINTHYINKIDEARYYVISEKKDLPFIMDAFNKIFININLFRKE